MVMFVAVRASGVSHMAGRQPVMLSASLGLVPHHDVTRNPATISQLDPFVFSPVPDRLALRPIRVG